jgi:hypothetical protein
MPSRKKNKGQVGGRHVARMRGAFHGWRLTATVAAKPEANAGPSGATRANMGAARANRATDTPQSLGPTGPFWAGG